MIENNLLTNTQLIGKLFCVWELSSPNNVYNSTPSNFFSVFLFVVFLRIFCRSHYFWNAETIIRTYHAMVHVHHMFLKVIGMIRQQFSSSVNKKLTLSANALCLSNFWNPRLILAHQVNLVTLLVNVKYNAMSFIRCNNRMLKSGLLHKVAGSCSPSEAIVWRLYLKIFNITPRVTHMWKNALC